MSLEDAAVEYVSERLNPEDVFDDGVLREWALDRDLVELDEDNVREYANQCMNVDDVFDTTDLEEWALENGFFKHGECNKGKMLEVGDA